MREHRPKHGNYQTGQALCRYNFIDKLYRFYMEFIDGTLLVFELEVGNNLRKMGLLLMNSDLSAYYRGHYSGFMGASRCWDD